MSRERTIRLAQALIVDDSGAMRLVIGRALARLGVTEVLEASNGNEGLKKLREGAAVEAVLVDWSMPVMDGLTFIKAVRAERRFDRVRLLMVTTEGDPAQMDARLFHAPAPGTFGMGVPSLYLVAFRFTAIHS